MNAKDYLDGQDDGNSIGEDDENKADHMFSKSDSSRKRIGDAFYPILCRSFFPTSSQQSDILKGVGTRLRDTVRLTHSLILDHPLTWM